MILMQNASAYQLSFNKTRDTVGKEQTFQLHHVPLMYYVHFKHLKTMKHLFLHRSIPAKLAWLVMSYMTIAACAPR